MDFIAYFWNMIIKISYNCVYSLNYNEYKNVLRNELLELNVSRYLNTIPHDAPKITSISFR